MEPWRLIATALLAAAGIVLVLVTMAKVRDHKGGDGAVALAGAISFTVLAVLCVLTLTVLPAALVWTVVGVTGVTVSVMVLAS